MLRIGICDDVYDARLVLRAALERAAEKRRITAAFFEFSAGENLLRWLEGHAGELDLVFLDLEMGDVDGIETARRLRAADEGLQIVFVTGHADRVFDGYGVGALGYLLKPPAPEALEEMLDRAGAALCRALERAYVCRSGEVYYRIPLQKILYFSSDRRQVTCVTADRSYTFYGKLDDVAAQLGPDFVRVHQRYLVRAAAVGVILFCLIMSLSALIDNYAAEVLWGGFTSDVFSLMLRAAALTGVWLVLKKRLPEQPVSLSPRLWRLVLGLAAMPLCSLAAVVLLTGGAEPSPQVDTLALKMGLAVLPVALATSVLLLFSITVLAEHETLEQARRLASLREAYYQALRARESQVRQLRHDLRNHLSVLGGLMEQKRWAEACAYMDELGRQEGLQGPMRFCENEAANVVLAVKAAELEQAGVRADFKAQLPSSLPLSDTDLCALLGNALDNAREGAARCPDPWVCLRCRQDKGLFMLRVENPVSGPVDPDLATTKADRAAHGFGIPGMREIAQRCGGTLQAGADQGRFCLLVSLPAGRS